MRKLSVLVIAFFCSTNLYAQSKNNSESEELYLTQLKAVEAFYRLNQINEAKKILNKVDPKLHGWEWQLLHARTDRSIQTLNGHTKAVVGISLSGDGKLLATGSGDNSIIIWDAITYKQLIKIEGHKGQVTTLDFSPDGKTLVSGSTDKTLRLWNMADGKEIRNYNEEFKQGIYQSVFSNDGTMLGVVSWELSPGNIPPVMGFAKVLDMQTGKLIQRFNTDGHPASAVHFSTDGKKLYTGTWGFHIKQHDIASGQTDWDYDLNQFDYYTAVQSIDMSGDGKYIVECGKDNRIRLLDASNGKLIYQVDPWQGHRQWVNGVRFSPDGKKFATVSDDGLLKVWETATGKSLFTFRGHDGGIYQLVWHDDGGRIFTSSADGTIKVWSIQQPGDKSFDVADNGPWYASVEPGGVLMAAATSDKKFVLWNLDKGKEEILLDSASAMSAVFSADGKYLVTGGDKGEVYAWEIRDKKLLCELKGHTKGVYGIAFHPMANDWSLHRLKAWCM